MTREEILAVAVSLATNTRYDRLTRAQVAKAAGCATGSVNYYFQDMAGLRDELLTEGVRQRIPSLIVAGIIDKHPAVASLTPLERAQALSAV